MSSKEVALSVRGLSKSYTIAHQAAQHTTLAEALLHRVRSPLQTSSSESFWALNDVEFDIHKGDVVGIIGRNGAGKSTLLKILSRITEPTHGEIDLFGRLGSLLEVGTGFHPELTGRENVFLNGAILGMRKREIERQFDAIVEFAGVERFLDTPVKRYSSGMYVRLAFAVAAHLELEIMVVDEVLAVGDLQFQRKCLGKMQDVAKSGRTVVFVSHQMQAVSALCSKAMYLESGSLRYYGTVQNAIDLYTKATPGGATGHAARRRPGSGELRLTDFRCDRMTYLPTDDIQLEMQVDVQRNSQPSFWVSLEIANTYGTTILHLDSRLVNQEFSGCISQCINYRIVCPRLAHGDYRVTAYLCSPGGIIDQVEDAAEFNIVPVLPYPASRNDCVGHALVYPEFRVSRTTAQILHGPTDAASQAGELVMA